MTNPYSSKSFAQLKTMVQQRSIQLPTHCNKGTLIRMLEAYDAQNRSENVPPALPSRAKQNAPPGSQQSTLPFQQARTKLRRVQAKTVDTKSQAKTSPQVKKSTQKKKNLGKTGRAQKRSQAPPLPRRNPVKAKKSSHVSSLTSMFNQRDQNASEEERRLSDTTVDMLNSYKKDRKVRYDPELPSQRATSPRTRKHFSRKRSKDDLDLPSTSSFYQKQRSAKPVLAKNVRLRNVRSQIVNKKRQSAGPINFRKNLRHVRTQSRQFLEEDDIRDEFSEPANYYDRVFPMKLNKTKPPKVPEKKELPPALQARANLRKVKVVEKKSSDFRQVQSSPAQLRPFVPPKNRNRHNTPAYIKTKREETYSKHSRPPSRPPMSPEMARELSETSKEKTKTPPPIPMNRKLKTAPTLSDMHARQMPPAPTRAKTTRVNTARAKKQPPALPTKIPPVPKKPPKSAKKTNADDDSGSSYLPPPNYAPMNPLMARNLSNQGKKNKSRVSPALPPRQAPGQKKDGPKFNIVEQDPLANLKLSQSDTEDDGVSPPPLPLRNIDNDYFSEASAAGHMSGLSSPASTSSSVASAGRAGALETVSNSSLPDVLFSPVVNDNTVEFQPGKPSKRPIVPPRKGPPPIPKHKPRRHMSMQPEQKPPMQSSRVVSTEINQKKLKGKKAQSAYNPGTYSAYDFLHNTDTVYYTQATAEEIPHGVEAITADWVNEHMTAELHLMFNPVLEVSIRDPGPHSENGYAYIIDFKYERQWSPKSLFVKFMYFDNYPPATQKKFLNEIRFYEKMYPSLKIADGVVPHCYYCRVNQDAGILMLQNMFEFGYTTPSMDECIPMTEMETLLKFLALFHAEHQNMKADSLSFQPNIDECPRKFYTNAVCQTKQQHLAAMVDLFEETFWVDTFHAFNQQIPPTTYAELRKLKELRIYLELSKAPASLCHGNICHDNIFLAQSEISVCDWQNFHFGFPMYDLVQFLVNHSFEYRYGGYLDVKRDHPEHQIQAFCKKMVGIYFLGLSQATNCFYGTLEQCWRGFQLSTLVAFERTMSKHVASGVDFSNDDRARNELRLILWMIVSCKSIDGFQKKHQRLKIGFQNKPFR